MTSSFSPIPSKRNPVSAAAVCEFKQTTSDAPNHFVIFFSNSFVFGPVVIHPDFNTSTIYFISKSVISGGENGISRFSSLFIYIFPLFI